ncbi:MAG: hypothetical protein KJZ70_14955 [Bryobacterales bacterium]|nr:hypothetical protein [Bryobacterales bacterium]
MATATKAKKQETKVEKVKENLYQAEYLGSGTFIITKPKRNPAKLSRARARNRRRGMRK